MTTKAPSVRKTPAATVRANVPAPLPSPAPSHSISVPHSSGLEKNQDDAASVASTVSLAPRCERSMSRRRSFKSRMMSIRLIGSVSHEGGLYSIQINSYKQGSSADDIFSNERRRESRSMPGAQTKCCHCQRSNGRLNLEKNKRVQQQ